LGLGEYSSALYKHHFNASQYFYRGNVWTKCLVVYDKLLQISDVYKLTYIMSQYGPTSFTGLSALILYRHAERLRNVRSVMGCSFQILSCMEVVKLQLRGILH